MSDTGMTHEPECKVDTYEIDMDSFGDKIHHPCTCAEIETAKKLAAIDRKENEEAWRKQAPKLGIHPDMHVKKSEREALGFFEEDRYV